VTYAVHFTFDLDAVPEPARGEIRRVMQQIAEVVDSVPGTSPFWSSMKNSVLQIDVGGWRVGYRIDSAHQLVRVIEATQIRP